MSDGPPMHFDFGPFRQGSHGLGRGGNKAGKSFGGGVSAYNVGNGHSHTGKGIGGLGKGIHGGLQGSEPFATNGGQQNDDDTQQGLDGVDGIDGQNASLVGDGSMDPDSIDQDAQDEAKDMLDGDKVDQQMQQILQQMMQTGMQAGQQASQQIGQLGQQFSQMFNQVAQQMGQMVSQATSAASHAATPAVDAASGLGDALGGAGAAGAGAAGATVPAGLEEPVTPMTTSPALVQGTGPVPPAAAGPAAAAGGSRMPMMPMMPMHGKDDDKDKRKRNPDIFPVGRIYEPPTGTVQNFGANPEIDAEAPPFGMSKTTA